MQTIEKIEQLRKWRRTQKSVALVPTMGNLHEGHMRLIDEAKKHADAVIVSIFVNPTQFGQGEDYLTYPRTPQQDTARLIDKNVDILFLPSVDELYPKGRQEIQIALPDIQNELCGAFRPGHFRGVATVVCKLFNIAQPDIACFGKKDYQQLHIIRSMVEEMNFPIQIIPVDTGRADDGLALSSRNGFLTETERPKATLLYQQLQSIKEAILSGKRFYSDLEHAATKTLTEAGWLVDYIEIRDSKTLLRATPDNTELVILGAARFGIPRLIDNIEVTII